MGRFIDLTGKKFHRVTVVERINREKGITGSVKWKVICDCGNSLIVSGCQLKSGHTKSCGCMKKERMGQLRKRDYIPGFQKTTEYQSWKAMIYRCTNKNYRYYHEYGGRGISVCERWRDFGLFLEDMGNKPSSKHSIDRINVNGDYEPNNCRWATYVEQARNKRTKKGSSGIRGVYLHKSSGKWIANIVIDGKKTILGLYSKKEDAANKRSEAEHLYWGKSS